MAPYSSHTGLIYNETAEKFENDKEFLSVIGPKTFALFKDLKQIVAWSKLSEKPLADLLKVLRDFYTPKKNVLTKRYACRNQRQQVGETFDDYILGLKGLACSC